MGDGEAAARVSGEGVGEGEAAAVEVVVREVVEVGIRVVERTVKKTMVI